MSLASESRSAFGMVKSQYWEKFRKSYGGSISCGKTKSRRNSSPAFIGFNLLFAYCRSLLRLRFVLAFFAFLLLRLDFSRTRGRWRRISSRCHNFRFVCAGCEFVIIARRCGRVTCSCFGWSLWPHRYLESSHLIVGSYQGASARNSRCFCRKSSFMSSGIEGGLSKVSFSFPSKTFSGIDEER